LVAEGVAAAVGGVDDVEHRRRLRALAFFSSRVEVVPEDAALLHGLRVELVAERRRQHRVDDHRAEPRADDAGVGRARLSGGDVDQRAAVSAAQRLHDEVAAGEKNQQRQHRSKNDSRPSIRHGTPCLSCINPEREECTLGIRQVQMPATEDGLTKGPREKEYEQLLKIEK
jgi:hypothetical protein